MNAITLANVLLAVGNAVLQIVANGILHTGTLGWISASFGWAIALSLRYSLDGKR